MYQWGKQSLANYVTLHPKLKLIADEALKQIDLTIVNGWRSKAQQDAAVAAGLSQTPWPTSKHNHVDAQGNPQSRAFDFALYADWSGTARANYPFLFTAGVLFSCANKLGIKVRLGWDFNQNFKADDGFEDLDHIELADSET